MRAIAALAALALVVGACSSDDDSSATTTSTSTTGPPDDTSTTTTAPAPTVDPAQQIQTFDDDCSGWGAAPAEGEAQLTFVRDGRLYGADLGGTAATCLDDDAPSSPFVWGPAADQVIAGSTVITASGSTEYRGAPLSASFTRPTGKSVIAVTDDGRLLKTNVETADVTDISFLDRHDAAAYYPSGTHVITGGEHADGTSGIWLATNVGTEPRLLASSPGTTFSRLSVGEDGGSLVFVADHGDERHVHRALLAGEELGSGTDERAAETIATTDGDVLALAASAFGWVAALVGRCGQDPTFVTDLSEDFHDAIPPRAWPIAWHPDDTALLVGHGGAGCPDGDEPFAVSVVSDTAEGVTTTLLVTGVTDAHLRWPVGEPPPPPSENFSGFV